MCVLGANSLDAGGESNEIQSTWGADIRKGSFTSQELGAECFHSRVNDYGYSIDVGSAAMRNIGPAGRTGRIQCAILHLSDGIARRNDGREKQLPDMGKIMNIASQLRHGESPTARQSGDL